ncbi:hypothetical protein DY000_02019980 [Brassica cretica]|uniref:Uncharacterized protein n=1 Tax=Brassica cretica TaxID=69181 RepID=A0ABQ7DD09_BRACR|nr:hypothetical protein DY000_02019980 [Brassica cretica]
MMMVKEVWSLCCVHSQENIDFIVGVRDGKGGEKSPAKPSETTAEEEQETVGQTEEDLSSPSRKMAPESSRDETASNEKSRDGKGGEKSPAKPSDTTAPSETTAEEEQETVGVNT